MDTCQRVDSNVRMNQGNLYPALRTLTANGFAVDRWESDEEQEIRIQMAGNDPRRGRKRRLYQVSKDGKKVDLSHTTESSAGFVLNPKPATG